MIHISQLVNFLPSLDIWVVFGIGIEPRTSFMDATMVVLDNVVG